MKCRWRAIVRSHFLKSTLSPPLALLSSFFSSTNHSSVTITHSKVHPQTTMAADGGRYPPFALSQDVDEDVDMFNFIGSAIPDPLDMTQEQQLEQLHRLLQNQPQHRPLRQQQELQQQEKYAQQPSMDAFMAYDDFSVGPPASESKRSKGKAAKGRPNEALNDEIPGPTKIPVATTSSSSSATPIDLRKEQNRAAQRAFRDRKERYLQQLENMVQDLKDQHFLVTNGFQKKILEISEKNEVLKSENHYLREVVFAFEASLSKGTAVTRTLSKTEGGTVLDSEEEQKGNCGCGYGQTVLQNVKEELYRRHHAIKAAAQGVNQKSPKLDAESRTIPTTPATPDVIMSESTKSESIKLASPEKREMDDSRDSEPVTKIPRKGSMSSVCSGNVSSSPEESQKKQSRGQELQAMPTSSLAAATRTNDILYKAPPLFIAPAQEEGGKPTLLSSPFDPLTIPRPSFVEPGGVLPKITEYLKHPTVFDELQSSLFPPGTLQSLVDSNMATPQEVIEDKSLFDSQQLSASQQQRALEELHSTFNRNNDEGNDQGSQNKGGRHGNISRSSFLPINHRLKKEFDIISSATPATDPKIDPMIYTIPHDPRIDVVPCPQLRAQMILHQDKYDVNEVFNLITSKAICHGPPLDPHIGNCQKRSISNLVICLVRMVSDIDERSGRANSIRLLPRPAMDLLRTRQKPAS